MTDQDFLAALQEACRRAGSQSALARQAGISQGRIADYLNKRYAAGNMTVGTVLKLFPGIVIDFFGDNKHASADEDLQRQLLEIFHSLDQKGKIRLVAMAAANFGAQLRKETKG